MSSDDWRRRPRKAVPAKVMTAVELYRVVRSTRRIAKMLGLGQATVWRALRRAGVRLLSRGKRSTRCCDCGRPTDGPRRCDFHRRVRAAELNREAVVRYRAKAKKRSLR